MSFAHDEHVFFRDGDLVWDILIQTHLAVMSEMADPAHSRTVQLGGRDYDYDSLSEAAKQLVGALRASEAEIRSLRNQLALMDVGRRALMSQLRLALENPEAFGRLQTPDGDQDGAEVSSQS